MVNDFAVKGYFNTGLGTISPDLNFKINERNNDKSSYNGILNTTNFNLGKFI